MSSVISREGIAPDYADKQLLKQFCRGSTEKKAKERKTTRMNQKLKKLKVA